MFARPQFFRFRLCGNLRTLVYPALTENEDTLHQHTFVACKTICNRPGTFESVRQSMIRRVHWRINLDGGHFKHLL